MGPLGTKFYELDEGATGFSHNGAQGAHVTIVPYFTVPEGKMEEFKAGFLAFYEHTKAGTGASGDCLYYDFAVGIAGEGGLSLAVMGPAAELEKLKEPMGPLGTKFYELDGGATGFSHNGAQGAHVTIVPYFTIPEGKMEEF